MVGSTYAVWWETGEGARRAGRLDLEGPAFVLTGGSNGDRAQEAIPFSEVEDIRLDGRRLYVTRRDGRSISIGSLDAPGALRELADRLASMVRRRVV